MTYEEFVKLPFKFYAHLSMADEHSATYRTDDKRFAFCVHRPYENGIPKGRAYKHYQIDGKVYKSKEKLIEALKQL